MKKICTLCLTILLIFTIVPCRAFAVIDVTEDKSVQQGCRTLDAKVPLLGSAPFTDNARSAILYDCSSETLMYAWNADEQLYPASFVKNMTAYIAVEKGDLSEEITVEANVLSNLPGDAVSADLQPGEIITLEDLLYCMVVSSANDAAAVIADHISGSQEAFVAEMNAYAQQLGCTGTKFMNVHGLHHDEQVTTARDTAKILAAAMQNEDFARIFNTAVYTVPATNKSPSRSLETVNHLVHTNEYEIYYDERVTGGRTGVTSDGYRCIVAHASVDNMQMISVVMGTLSEFESDGYTPRVVGGFYETSDLLDMGIVGFKETQILYNGQILKQQAVTNGNADVSLGCQSNISVLIPYDVDINDLIFKYSDVPGAFQAPVTRGDVLSQIEIWYGSVCIGHTDLVAMNDVDILGTVEQNDTTISNDVPVGKIVVFTILGMFGVVLLCFIILFVVREVRKTIRSRRGRKYRRDRRRSR